MKSLHHSDPTRSAHRASPLLLLVVATLLATLTACGSSDDASSSGEVWRFAIEETEGSVQHRYATEFAERIATASDGAVEVKVYPYGTLGTSDDLTEQLQMGSLQFAMASPGHLGKTIPELQAFLLHFVFSDDDDVNLAAIRDAEFRAVLDPLFPPFDMELLTLLPEGWMVWTTQREVREPSDFEGIKIRTMTSPLLLALYEAYGASPQAMPYGEVYSALQLNMIDAQVNPVFAIEEMSFHEVTSHMIRARPAPFLTTVVANARFLDSLSPERRALVERVVDELDADALAAQQRLNEERLSAILDDKPEMVVVELEDAEREAFRRLSLPVREEFVEMAGDGGRAVLDALLAAVERARTDQGTDER